MIERLRIGAHVYAADGKRVGALSRVVVAGPEPRVTHLVVEPSVEVTGLGELLSPGGMAKPRDRTVPVELTRDVSEERITLTCDEAAFAQLPIFERREYADAPVEPGASRFRMGDLVNYLASTFGLGGAPYVPETEETLLNEAAGAASIPRDTPVWRNTPHEEIGVVVRTLADSATQQVLGLVIRRATMQEDVVIVPAGAITAIEDGVARVEMTDEELDHLPQYDERAGEQG